MEETKSINTYHLGNLVRRRKCAECGKDITFIGGQRLEDYGYKYRDGEKIKVFCSWSCLKKFKVKAIQKKKRKTIEDINWLRWVGAYQKVASSELGG